MAHTCQDMGCAGEWVYSSGVHTIIIIVMIHLKLTAKSRTVTLEDCYS
jgi:hypothetical protein